MILGYLGLVQLVSLPHFKAASFINKVIISKKAAAAIIIHS